MEKLNQIKHFDSRCLDRRSTISNWFTSHRTKFLAPAVSFCVNEFRFMAGITSGATSATLLMQRYITTSYVAFIMTVQMAVIMDLSRSYIIPAVYCQTLSSWSSPI